MLTYEEAIAACAEAGKMTAPDFMKLIADYIPQDVIDDLNTDMVKISMENGNSMETAAHEAAMFNVGFHYGWVLCRATFKDKS